MKAYKKGGGYVPHIARENGRNFVVFQDTWILILFRQNRFMKFNLIKEDYERD